jgi:hypothetical protein
MHLANIGLTLVQVIQIIRVHQKEERHHAVCLLLRVEVLRSVQLFIPRNRAALEIVTLILPFKVFNMQHGLVIDGDALLHVQIVGIEPGKYAVKGGRRMPRQVRLDSRRRDNLAVKVARGFELVVGVF